MHRKQNSIRHLCSYLFLIPLVFVSYASTRGADGDLLLSVLGFGILGGCYCSYLALCVDRTFAWHLVIHIFLFPLVCLLASIYESRLEGMAGILLYANPVFCGLMVFVGAVCIGFGASNPGNRRRPGQCRYCEYDMRGTVSEICPECGKRTQE